MREADLEAPDPVQPTELWEISYCYFKPVSFGFVSYTEINWNIIKDLNVKLEIINSENIGIKLFDVNNSYIFSIFLLKQSKQKQ